MEKLYVINIPPQAWKRPGTNGKRFYDQQTQEKLILGITINQQHDGLPLYVTPISLDITFFMPMPKHKKKKPISAYHSQRPDIDNLAKLILDAATGILWEDDKIIAKLCAQKVYGGTPRIEFCVTELE